MQPRPGTALTLPTPDEASAAHSEKLAKSIAGLIGAGGGSISFAEFMQHSLYAPGLGYYVAGTSKFGAGGDFVTAPEISPLFGRVLARQSAVVMAPLAAPEILELGAGSGVLAATMLETLADFNALPERYAILEVSPELQQRQRDELLARVPEFIDRVSWIAELPSDFTGVVIANEVADALPVERFAKVDDQVLQCRVAADGDGFDWQHQPAPAVLAGAVAGIEHSIGRPLPNGYESEVCLALAPWIEGLVRSVAQGVILLFDYGVTAREYYAPDRQGGWLRCHFRHHAHNDPLILPGIQDLTAWVNFSALADAAVTAGADVGGFVTQAHWLVNGGLQEELAGFESLPQAEQIELSKQTKLLTLPEEMGENFKCIGLCVGDVEPPPALRVGDRTHRL
jgi:SAM-dependent MidA family methyltransferase